MRHTQYQPQQLQLQNLINGNVLGGANLDIQNRSNGSMQPQFSQFQPAPAQNYQQQLQIQLQQQNQQHQQQQQQSQLQYQQLQQQTQPIDSQSIVSMQSRKKRSRRNDKNNRDFTCGCGKRYLSYPALYTHLKQKHDGKAPAGTIQHLTDKKGTRGRPRKDEQNKEKDLTQTNDSDITEDDGYNSLDNYVFYLQEVTQNIVNESGIPQLQEKNFSLIIENTNVVAAHPVHDFPRDIFNNPDDYALILNYIQQITDFDGQFDEEYMDQDELNSLVGPVKKPIKNTNCNIILAKYLYRLSKHIKGMAYKELVFMICMYRKAMNVYGPNLNIKDYKQPQLILDDRFNNSGIFNEEEDDDQSSSILNKHLNEDISQSEDEKNLDISGKNVKKVDSLSQLQQMIEQSNNDSNFTSNLSNFHKNQKSEHMDDLSKEHQETIYQYEEEQEPLQQKNGQIHLKKENINSSFDALDDFKTQTLDLKFGNMMSDIHTLTRRNGNNSSNNGNRNGNHQEKRQSIPRKLMPTAASQEFCEQNNGLLLPFIQENFVKDFQDNYLFEYAQSIQDFKIFGQKKYQVQTLQDSVQHMINWFVESQYSLQM